MGVLKPFAHTHKGAVQFPWSSSWPWATQATDVAQEQEPNKRPRKSDQMNDRSRVLHHAPAGEVEIPNHTNFAYRSRLQHCIHRSAVRVRERVTSEVQI